MAASESGLERIRNYNNWLALLPTPLRIGIHVKTFFILLSNHDPGNPLPVKELMTISLHIILGTELIIYPLLGQ